MLAECVTEDSLAESRIYPPLDKIGAVSLKIAVAITKLAYQEGLAGLYPEPCNKKEFVKLNMYKTEYETFLPDCYDWPREAANNA